MCKTKASLLAFMFLCFLLPLKSAIAKSKTDRQIPDTTAGRVFAEFLQAYNTGDKEAMSRFFLAHATQTDPEARQQSINRRVAWVANIYKGYRELKLDRITRSTEHSIVALCQSKITEAWCEWEIEVDSAPPPGVAIGFTYATRPADAYHGRRLSQGEIIENLNRYMKNLVSADLFSGVVLVANSGRPIFKKGYGSSNTSSKVPNGAHTKFSLASMSKMFTGVAIVQLAQQGKLSFADPIGQHLSDYPNQQVAKRVTIHHLLTHTSGLGDYMGKDEFHAARKAAGGRFESLKSYFPFFVDDPLRFDPGERFQYSSSGYILLGAIIEKLSGQSYFDYVTQHIFKPLGMQDTDARGETGSPAGSAVSTIEDLLKFENALRNNKLLTAKYTDILLTPKVGEAFGGWYAYGFLVRGKDTDSRVVGHGGESVGVNTQFDMYLDKGYSVIVLSNYDPPAARNVAAKLQEMIDRPQSGSRIRRR